MRAICTCGESDLEIKRSEGIFSHFFSLTEFC
jgi:hypothetical protein